VNTVEAHSKLVLISSKILLAKLRASIAAIDEDVLGFKTKDVGILSLRSGAAIAMYLYNLSILSCSSEDGAVPFFYDTFIAKSRSSPRAYRRP
jgi:hypothetical protein